MVNWIVSLISPSELSHLVYRNAADFYVLVLYPATLQNSFMNSNSFLVVSLWFPRYSIMSSAVIVLFLLFQFWFLLFLFLLCLPLLGPPKWWITVVKLNILVLFLTLAKMLSGFHHWAWCQLWVCHIWLLFCWGRLSLWLICGEFLSEMGVEFSPKLFCTTKMITGFYFSVCWCGISHWLI